MSPTTLHAFTQPCCRYLQNTSSSIPTPPPAESYHIVCQERPSACHCGPHFCSHLPAVLGPKIPCNLFTERRFFQGGLHA
ncbi:hypothetical protein T4A_9528 [Trichinella pseudospiralis]|uniref:Uncharacterized protein n=1 Tax=Trichinella pseudospiralis TaxID=6337 RepID=A0A0V1DRC4_TRIPS|nr:hypothetical protein T4A_9528 [Trichinella pseudospiralis]